MNNPASWNQTVKIGHGDTTLNNVYSDANDLKALIDNGEGWDLVPDPLIRSAMSGLANTVLFVLDRLRESEADEDAA